MIVKKIRGVIVSFPSKEVMEEILEEAKVKPEEVEDVDINLYYSSSQNSS